MGCACKNTILPKSLHKTMRRFDCMFCEKGIVALHGIDAIFSHRCSLSQLNKSSDPAKINQQKLVSDTIKCIRWS